LEKLGAIGISAGLRVCDVADQPRNDRIGTT
jgi:hypothetical protein